VFIQRETFERRFPDAIVHGNYERLQVQTRLRNLSPSTGVLGLTSKDDPWVRSKAMDAGARAFFLKPVDEDQFLATIASAFSDK
jgi:DNA-binding NarL/FixJ family response regulator